MRHIKALITALMLVLALAPVATATYDCNQTPEGPSFYIPPGIVESDIETLAELQGYCGACGYSTTSPNVGFNAVDSSNSIIVYRNNALWGDWDLSAQNNTRYVQRFYNCQGNYVRPSDLSCAGNNFAIAYDVLYREPRSLFECTAGTLPNVTANFTATPTQGTGPLYVSFTDTSTGFPFTWNWSITPATGWLTGPYDLDNEDLTVLFTDNGNYTISHGVNNTKSSDIETKIDYIWIFNSTSTVTTGVTAQDMYSGYPVQGAQVNLFDVENSSWTNTTTGANGKGEITTLVHHTINAYASAGGYDDNEALGLDADGSGYVVVLTPSGFANVSAGSVTAYVTVVDDDGSFRIPEARVDVSYGGASYSIQTNAAGVASFVVPNQTNVLVHARKAGYAGASKSFNSGTGSGGDAHVDVEVRLAKTEYTPTITATPLPSGVTATPTVDLYPCDADHPENCQRKQTEMANILVEWGPDLVMFFIVLTLIGGAKMIGK